MSIIFCKNLFKCFPTMLQNSHPSPSEQDQDHPLLPPTTATATAGSILIKNYNSIYDLSSKSSSTPSTNSFFSSFSSEFDSDTDSPPDFATIYASQRFFFSSPGQSNSIFESLDTPSKPQTTPLLGGVAVKKYSPDPYTDFKHSMQEMIEARQLTDVRTNWEYLHELLSCYLSLNPRHTHKFIVSAFADIIICLLSSSDETHQKTQGSRQDNI